MLLYTYNKKKDFESRLEGPVKDSIAKNKYILSYQSPYQSGNKLNDTAYCEIYSNRGLEQSENLLIFIHGFATNKRKLKNYHYFLEKMSARDYTCAFINLPLHLKRAPKDANSGKDLLYYDDKDTLEFFHQSVVDVKRLIDILAIYKFKKIFICGLSLGSMVGALSICHDNRINKAALLMGGGNWEEVHWKGVLRFMLKGNCADRGDINRSKCHSYYSYFPKFMEALEKNNPEKIDTENLGTLEEVTRKMCFLCDPAAFGHKANPENILMVNARFDLYFSRSSTIKLWESLGKPEIHWLNTFHSSKILRKPKIIGMIDNFFKK